MSAENLDKYRNALGHLSARDRVRDKDRNKDKDRVRNRKNENTSRVFESLRAQTTILPSLDRKPCKRYNITKEQAGRFVPGNRFVHLRHSRFLDILRMAAGNGTDIRLFHEKKGIAPRGFLEKAPSLYTFLGVVFWDFSLFFIAGYKSEPFLAEEKSIPLKTPKEARGRSLPRAIKLWRKAVKSGRPIVSREFLTQTFWQNPGRKARKDRCEKIWKEI